MKVVNVHRSAKAAMNNTALREQALRHDIMNVVKANGLEVSGDFWFALIFRTEAELRSLARELHIKVASLISESH